MKPWLDDPSPVLAAVFGDILLTRMAGLAFVNPALQVEPLGFRRDADGHWSGVLVTPWAINLLRLPGGEGWPATLAGGRHDWRFASGDYEFTVAEEERLGRYHLCSLFSPVFDFATHEQARLTALAAILALDQPPLDAMPEPAATEKPPSTRRAFLGLGR